MVATNGKSVCVAGGTGGLGYFIAKALCQKKSEIPMVTILTRPESEKDQTKRAHLDELRRLGAKTVTVDFSNVSDLRKALEGFECVVSALSIMALGREQLNLIEAAKTAGVKHFCPSEFGVDTTLPECRDIAFLEPKRAALEALKKSGMSYTVFITGFFIDTFFTTWFGWDIEQGKATVPGEGKEKITMITREDVGKFVAEALVHGKPGNTIKVSGETMTMDDCVKTIEKATGKKMMVKHETADELKKRITSSHDATKTILDTLKHLVATGHGSFTPVNNKDYPTVKPMTLEKWAGNLSTGGYSHMTTH